jgi:CBS domain-containing protein
MTQAIREVMTKNPVTLGATESAAKAATAMKEADTGAIVVTEDGGAIRGIVTDRDIVVRAVAEGRDPDSVQVGEICSGEVTTLRPDQPVEEAIRVMRDKSVRRIPVTEDATVVGIVSIGDLAIERDEDSALAEISAAPGND